MNEVFSIKTGSVLLSFPFARGSHMAWSGTGTDPVFIEKVDILFFVNFLYLFLFFKILHQNNVADLNMVFMKIKDYLF